MVATRLQRVQASQGGRSQGPASCDAIYGKRPESANLQRAGQWLPGAGGGLQGWGGSGVEGATWGVTANR